MKALLFLLFSLAFISANYTPYWYDCGNTTATNVFTPTNVTVQKDPKNETHTLVSYCGAINSHDAAATIFRKLILDQIVGPFREVYTQIMFKVAPNGSNFCLSYSEPYSNSGYVLVWMTAYNILGDQVACVNMTLNWTDNSSNNQFLSKRNELIF